MKDYRAIEITEGCMGGEGAIYCTDAPASEILAAIANQLSGKIEDYIEYLETRYTFDCIMDSLATIDYSRKSKIFKSLEVYDISEIEDSIKEGE